MPTRRTTLRTIPAALAVGLAGCAGRSLLAGSSTSDDDPSVPVTWETWLHGARFGMQSDAAPLIVHLGGAQPPPDRRRHAFVGISPETGDRVWEVDEGHDLADAASPALDVSVPTVAGERMYTLTDLGVLCALDASTGTLEWTNEDAIPGDRTGETPRPSESPIPFDDFVCIATRNADDGTSVFAFDADDGAERWTCDLAADATSTPAAGTSSLVVPCEGGTVEAIGTDGERRWSVSIDDTVTGIAIENETVFAAGIGETIYAFDPKDGTERWRTDFESAATTTPTLVGDTVVVGSADRALTAIDAADGNREWRRTLDNAPTKVAVADGRLLTLTGTNGLAYDTTVDVPEEPVTLGVHDASSGATLNDYEYDGDDRRGWMRDVVSDGDDFYLVRHETVSRVGETFLEP